MGHYYSEKPQSKSKPKMIEININGETYNFRTDSGVFSKDYLDQGTKILLETIDYNKLEGNILDLGCGYGPIGIHIKRVTNLEVDMIDINERCLFLAHENAKFNNVNVNIFKSDLYKNVITIYNYIITNPPIRIGRDKVFELLFNSFNYLKEDGELWFVINKKQGAKSVFRELLSKYNVKVVNKEKGFYVMCVKKH